MVTATGMLLAPMLVALLVHLGQQYEACIGRHGPPPNKLNDVSAPCYRVALWTGILLLAFYAVVLATSVTGFILGVVEGRRRYRFAYGRWLCVVVIGISGPWALLAYALAYGLGRLLPARRPRKPPPSEVALQHGWQQALHLYQRLARGEPPPTVIAPGFLGPGAVYLDAPLHYSRFYGTTVTYGQSWTYAYGSPAFVTGALVGNLIGNSIARTQAANLARPQWREFTFARVVVTPTTTWCCVNGQWLAFDHDAALEYVLDGPACILTFAGVEPLRLWGPSAWCYAIMYAYARYGPRRWQDAPFLHPIREVARTLTMTTHSTAPIGKKL